MVEIVEVAMVKVAMVEMEETEIRLSTMQYLSYYLPRYLFYQISHTVPAVLVADTGITADLV